MYQFTGACFMCPEAGDDTTSARVVVAHGLVDDCQELKNDDSMPIMARWSITGFMH
jgi:hypothetical protein